VAASAPPPTTADCPARARGLRRKLQGGGYASLDDAPPPAAPTPRQLLALLSRERAARGVRPYDLRVFVSLLAVLRYLHRLGRARPARAQIVSSMPQLVAGLAPIMGWERSDDRFADRDAHHASVRRWLDLLQAIGLIRWQAGINDAGEEARTEITLLAVPDVDDAQLRAAGGRLATWRRRYGPNWDTGARRCLPAIGRRSRPPTPAQRKKQAIARARARAGACRSSTDSAPPCGAPANAGEQHLEPSASSSAETTACGQGAGVTRTHAYERASAPAAINAVAKAGEEGGAEASWEERVQAVVERVATREAQRQDILAVIAGQAQRRALEVASWGLDRSWPEARLREAWVVARYGPGGAAQHGAAAAGRLPPEDRARLERAARRYARYADHRPERLPVAPLAALLTLAGASGDWTLMRTIRRLDQLSRRMRARATAAAPARHQAVTRRARRRRTEDAPPGRLAFRAPGPRWPRWIRTTPAGEPVFDSTGELQLDAEQRPPAPGSLHYRLVVRDAYLLTGRQPPVEVDGRWEMKFRDDGHLPPSAYLATRDVDPELLELARLTALPLRALQRWTPDRREHELARLRSERAATQRVERQAFHTRLAALQLDDESRS
jgi:hypothetical protein